MLSHDASMKHVYSAQNGALLQTFMGWLRKDDLQLKVTASLAIGNFACSDEHTEQLVDELDAAENLVGLLRSQVRGLEKYCGMDEKAGPRLCDQASCLPLATGASSRSLR